MTIEKNNEASIDVTGVSYIEFNYVNWRGLTSYRKVRVKQMYYGTTEHHLRSQWLMEALDLDKREMRIFAMEDMENVIDSMR